METLGLNLILVLIEKWYFFAWWIETSRALNLDPCTALSEPKQADEADNANTRILCVFWVAGVKILIGYLLVVFQVI